MNKLSPMIYKLMVTLMWFSVICCLLFGSDPRQRAGETTSLEQAIATEDALDMEILSVTAWVVGTLVNSYPLAKSSYVS